MGTVLSRKYTKDDSSIDIISAILKLASDKLERLMLVDDNAWKGEKLKEIARLARILKARR